MATFYKMGLKRMKIEDLNFDKNYSAMDAYCQIRLGIKLFCRINDTSNKGPPYRLMHQTSDPCID